MFALGFEDFIPICLSVPGGFYVLILEVRL